MARRRAEVAEKAATEVTEVTDLFFEEEQRSRVLLRCSATH